MNNESHISPTDHKREPIRTLFVGASCKFPYCLMRYSPDPLPAKTKTIWANCSKVQSEDYIARIPQLPETNELNEANLERNIAL